MDKLLLTSQNGRSEAVTDEINKERQIYEVLQGLVPELIERLEGLDLEENGFDYSHERLHRGDNNSNKEMVKERPVEIANFTEKSANEMERIAKSADFYNLTNEGEHEEHDDDDAEDEDINLEHMLQTHHRENNADYEEDENFELEMDDVVDLSGDNEGGNANGNGSKEEFADFYNKVPGLEYVLRGAIKRCETGVPKANKKDKSDLFKKYQDKAYIFLRCLRYIYAKFQMRERPVTAILKLVQWLWAPELPLDVRSIMRHSYDVGYNKVEEGIHCCDLPVEELVRNMLIEYQTMGEKLPKKLKIHFNADGLNTSRSSNQKFYVFLLGFPQLKWDPIVMCHLLDGTPTNQSYYESTIKYLNKVHEHGIPDVLPNGDTLRVEVEGGFFDRQGLSNALWVLSHVSKHGCPHCRIEGVSSVTDDYDPQGSLPKKRKKLNFYERLPSVLLDWTMIVPSRKDRTARARMENNVKQLNGETPVPRIFEIFKEFDVVQQVPGDSLHQVFLAQKQLYKFITTGEGASQRYKKTQQPSKGEVYMMHDRIEKCHSFVTRKLFANRIPRSNFHDDNQKYKAAEIRCLVLYCYPITFSVLRSQDIKRIANTLFYILRILENESLIKRFLGTLDELKAFNILLRHLVEDYANVFGAQSITYNRHAWLHLGYWVYRFGPLSSWGCWRFENFNHYLAGFLHSGSHNTTKEACNRYLERCSTSFFLNWEKPKDYQPQYWLEEAEEVNILKIIFSCENIVWTGGFTNRLHNW